MEQQHITKAALARKLHTSRSRSTRPLAGHWRATR
jgi:hypothetical protein